MSTMSTPEQLALCFTAQVKPRADGSFLVTPKALNSGPLTVAQVAERLGCTDRHVENLIDCGQLIATNIASQPEERRCLRISSTALDDF
jgi:excisionase family DNA binding protein